MRCEVKFLHIISLFQVRLKTRVLFFNNFRYAHLSSPMEPGVKLGETMHSEGLSDGYLNDGLRFMSISI